MFKNYLKVALRNMARYKLFSFINVTGLALSLSFCLLVILIIHDQLSFDRFHPRAEDIYRVNTTAHRKDGGTENYASSPRPLGTVLESESPVVESVARLTMRIHSEATHKQRAVPIISSFADPAFLPVFGFALLTGDSATALTQPYSLVLTSEAATRIFGSEEPMDQTVTINGVGDFVVTGVLKPFPGKTHFDFEALISSAAMPVLEKAGKISPVLENWNDYYTTYTYVRLKHQSSIASLKTLLAQIPGRFYSSLQLESRDKGYSFALQPLDEITPGPILSQSVGKGMPALVLIFLSVLALIGMIAAVFNYTNLTLARSLTRAKEVGIRKVIGASRLHVCGQFVGEAMLTVLLSLAAAEALLRLLLIPGFQRLQFMNDFAVDFNTSSTVYLAFVIFAILTGLISGLAPGIFISAFRPVQILKDVSRINVLSKITLRKVLIVFQFALTLTLLIVLTTVYRQASYALQLDYYGFDWHDIVNIELQGKPYQLVAQEMARHPGVVGYSASSHNMGTWEDSAIDVRKTTDEEPVGIRDYSVDSRFVENFGLGLIAGSNFRDEADANNDNLVLVNERFLEKFELGTPHEAVGATLILGKDQVVQIAGVMKDFIFKPLSYTLQPMLLRHDPSRWRILNLKVQTRDMVSAVARFEKTWKAIDPAHPISFAFYDVILQRVYDIFRDLMFIIGFLSVLAFSISVLGLLGIATYTAETKIKEVGIRKVFGAGVHNLVLLLSRQYLVLLSVATFVAIPVGILISNLVLQEFAYRIAVGPGIVLPGILAVFLLSALTVGWQALRVALANTVEALRYE